MARKPPRAVRARSTFKVPGIGDVYEGDLFRSDDPLVVGREQLFEDVNELLSIPEQATKNPGQKRRAAKPAPVPKPEPEPLEAESSDSELEEG